MTLVDLAQLMTVYLLIALLALWYAVMTIERYITGDLRRHIDSVQRQLETEIRSVARR